jgi:two-component system, OmpR family, sensor histidine kinase KdpD
MTKDLARGGLAAPYSLPAAFAALFAVGTVAAGLHGRFPATDVLIASAAIAGIAAVVSEILAAVPLGIIGWLTVVGFSRPPYAELRPTGALAAQAAVVLAATAIGAGLAGLVFRYCAARFTLDGVRQREPGTSEERISGIGLRRQLAGVALAAAGLPALTALLASQRQHLNLSDDLLIYLVAVVAVTIVGGFWPAVLAAVAACLLLNWYFTEPLHTFTIGEPKNLLALVLFVTVAVAVSSFVHLSARRQAQAARSAKETASLLTLAQTVLGGADTPADVLDHLTSTHGGRAELLERVRGQWVKVAESGGAPAAPRIRFEVRPDLALEVSGQRSSATASLLAGFTAQAVAALDRARLRTQVAQAEALAEGNRMRTALLAAVSHDLRTPLASIKASVSSLRQTDVAWTPEDEAALLATVEQNADRLDALIGNLLDMSRLQAGSLAPFLRPTAVDEVAPVALRGLDDSDRMRIVVPDGLPLVKADPGLLERVLANLFSNALRYSPADEPPALVARALPAPALPARDLPARDAAARDVPAPGGLPPGDPPAWGSSPAPRVRPGVVIEIIDHGRGVPAEAKERIFEPFQRLDDRVPGIGLGLSVAKGFTEAMGGTIEAVDTPHGGLTMRLTLLAATSEVPAEIGAVS